MPLMRNNSFVEDSYRHIADEEAIPTSGDIIVPLARIEEASGRFASAKGKLGIHVPNNVKPASSPAPQRVYRYATRNRPFDCRSICLCQSLWL